jgi:hypothetical protein
MSADIMIMEKVLFCAFNMTYNYNYQRKRALSNGIPERAPVRAYCPAGLLS